MQTRTGLGCNLVCAMGGGGNDGGRPSACTTLVVARRRPAYAALRPALTAFAHMRVPFSGYGCAERCCSRAHSVQAPPAPLPAACADLDHTPTRQVQIRWDEVKGAGCQWLVLS